MQLPDAVGCRIFAERFGFDLSDAFARDAKLFADFFQRSRVSISDAKA